MNKQVKVTKEGLMALQKELDELVNVKRPRLVERLSRARSEGDLAENSDYHSARDELEFLDGRIAEIDTVLKNAVVAPVSNGHGKVGLGAKVSVKYNGSQTVYHLVGEWEADPVKSKISIESPLGQALLGKKKGDRVEVEAPAGKVVYEVLSIK
ncbi:transcription elongation factor GreA [Candidatus Woesebacteria bacterium RIFCSPLOWO2_01_FULL_39_21]|uniref:Transcription elongation factor GreA n=1 Tax=Candidatus Woesebacteria bacterium RIFCSPLOWO2_01_FULL_39_21 TaxID=1802519 RepID=A0A1F8BDM9_9BACT|nr:MAG: transcription elongation factor GreA [Candidatus Woesebacteria bacterium RIFCSPHIGHO2_01_FULL_39_23]OGM62142.1 MAG: transcription elongation factor GreA [Candidatus Woesebacteria bacterium RIFCSPLOWO2_01_FULL_39_21]